MKRGFITQLIDSFVTFVASALFCAVAAGYFVKGFGAVLPAALIGGLGITALVSGSRRRKNVKPDPDAETAINQFVYGGGAFALEHFRDALSKKYRTEAKDGFIMAGAAAVFPSFSPKKLDHASLAAMYAKARNASAKRLIILTKDGADKEAAAVIAVLPDISVTVLDTRKVYSLLLYLGAVPPAVIKLKSRTKPNAVYFFSGAVSPQRSRGYFFTSLILALSAFIMPYAIYYTVFSALCLILGVLSSLDVKTRLTKAPRTPSP